MRKLLKSFKTEINPTEEQKVKIRKTIGTCRYIYNFYLTHNKELYDKGEKFMSGKSFSIWLNNEYLPRNPDKLWIKEVSSKSVKRSIENGCIAFTRFFKHQSAFPNFKKKGKSDVKMYFVKNNPKDCRCERHRINIPSLGWIRIKEKGYIPTTKDGYVIKSGHVSIRADKYYVSVLIEILNNKIVNNFNEGIGIDLGLKDFAIVSNGKNYKNINKSAKLKKLEKQLIREQRSLSRKYENLKKGWSTQKTNIQSIHDEIVSNVRENLQYLDVSIFNYILSGRFCLMPKIITIAREYGSGGRIIAQKVANLLGLVYYDNQIIDLAAQELGFDIETIRKAAQEKSSGFLYGMAGGTFQMPLNDQVFATQSKIIRHLANNDSCIIVNGCADYILEDYDKVLRVFIHAPLESRIKRVEEEYKEEHENTKKYVISRDKKRSNYYNYYTTNKWGQLKNFDLTINSDYGLDEAAEIIAEMYKKL